MPRIRTFAELCVLFLLSGFAVSAEAQNVNALGTRAQGMAGAFVGVADDASAVYWNPAGLASGAYFSLVLDGNADEAIPDGPDDSRAGKRSGGLVALTTPALGISYFRLTASMAASRTSGTADLSEIVTHNVGFTLVQSLADGIAVGATIRAVRGFAGAVEVDAPTADDALENWDVMGRTTSRLDLDVGLMASGSLGRLGVVVRNVTEPGFETGAGGELTLERQVRAGGSIWLLHTWKLSADVDLTRSRGVFSDVREAAVGTEGQITRRIAARGGVRFNTAGDAGRSPAVAVGGSYAVTQSFLVDGQVTRGSDSAFQGWGVAGRVVF
jgi:hypothetical protein